MWGRIISIGRGHGYPRRVDLLVTEANPRNNTGEIRFMHGVLLR